MQRKSSPVDVITGFPLSKLGDDGLSVGPMGLLFLDRRRLVVGVSGDAAASVRLFELADEAAALSADSAKQQITLESRTAQPQPRVRNRHEPMPTKRCAMRLW